MLRISKLTDYATLIMSCLASAYGQVQSATRIAELLHLSLPTVSKILKMLAEAKLVGAIRGAEGGYHLLRPAAEITLAEVIAAIEGQVAMTQCCEKTNLCALNGTCTVRDNWRTINRMIHGFLSRVTINEMTKPLPQQDWNL